MDRRSVLKSRRWVVLSGLALVGLSTTNATRRRLGERDSSAASKTGLEGIQLETTTLDKETVKLNAQGTIVESRPVQVTMFQEDLGNGVTLRMVEIPAGEFDRGSPSDEVNRDYDEDPVRRVSMPRFYMGMFEVTQAQYQAVMGGENPAEEHDDEFVQADKPVVGVSWRDAAEFCRKLIDRTGRSYRLPSEAEWEYACRAGTTTPFYFGETLSTDVANYDGNHTYGDGQKGEYRNVTTAVGSFPPNGLGLFDMHGNVWEWCADHYRDSYDNAPTDGSAWRSNDDDSLRVLRGGSWVDPPIFCRSAYRFWYSPGDRTGNVGFRVVCAAA